MKTLKDYFDKIYVINYIEAHDRRENMIKQLKYYNFEDGIEFSYGMPFAKIKAIAPHFEELSKKVRYNVSSIPSIGCAFQHYTTIKTAYELGANSVLILEDDIIFRDDRDLIINYLDNIPKDWNYIFFDMCFTSNSIFIEDINLLASTSEKYIKLTNFLGGRFCQSEYNKTSGLVSSGAYALNRTAMELYILIFENSPIIVNSDMLEYFYHNTSQSPLVSYTTKDKLFAVSNEIDTLKFDEKTKKYQINDFLVAPSIDINSNNFKFKIDGSIITNLKNINYKK